ncbi:MAG: undecaprenyldiphospho-muramoylpentapeptide beta-N-acetylglucosaminyltransferase [Candidatus Omnitrophica bacterium]|nr:undecaprenyldiphospho-muramoylpentapeptide beta-N-acetylglucosaminyltransferase [Candidatus Omnitrophota bacterium]MDD5654560.1 undecaprenyldiphospho-muramoylpentapeptide beta-N-acetylglucosaminyltransferase [Candidatus Omnitrophota bacterium]
MKILAASGGSGGHIFPALSFLGELKKKRRDAQVILVVNKRSALDYVFPAEYKLAFISSSPVEISLKISNILSLLRLLLSAFQSLGILLRYRPDVVVGFGGYPSIFLVIFARFLRIKTVIHEQNVLPGRANKFLCPLADKIAISFPQSRQYLKKYAGKTVFTGNMARPEILKKAAGEAWDFFGFSKHKFTILVMGGSQGSRKINNHFLDCLSLLDDRDAIQVIHLCGRSDLKRLSAAYKDSGVQARVFDFLKEMRYAYTVSSLIISRAGAATIAELMSLRVPAVIIPYPHARQHQLYNARVLTDKGAAILLEDKDLNAYSLKEKIADLLTDRAKLEEMRGNYDKLEYPAVEQDLSGTVLSLI